MGSVNAQDDQEALMLRRMSLSILGLLYLGAAAAAAQVIQEPNEIEIFSLRSGEADFQHYCAVCHGTDARGKGPLAKGLVRKPPDLTRLAARNAGNFPADRIFWMIDGRADMHAHGPREMPVWGREFARDESGLALNPETEARIHNLVNYLKVKQRD